MNEEEKIRALKKQNFGTTKINSKPKVLNLLILKPKSYNATTDTY